MLQIVAAAVITLYGLWAVFMERNLALLPILAAFAGGIWLLISIIRYATRKRPM